MSFRQATAVRRTGDDTFEADVPDLWQQGRGAFGGLVFGTILRAACEHEPDPTRRARTFACDVAGPVQPGPAEVRVHTLRRGRSQTNLQLTLTQAGEVLASALCTLSAERPLAADHPVTARSPATPPDALRDFEAVPVMPSLHDRGGPVFTQHYEYRLTGVKPFKGAAEAENAGFIREPSAEGTLDAPGVVALLDAYYPAIFAVVPKGGQVMSTTASFNAQLMQIDEPIAAGAPLFFRGRTEHYSHGFDVEFRELWYRDKLVGLNQQTFVVLR
ncbi:MAG: thioesterase family protein [Polyangiales bacterium]